MSSYEPHSAPRGSEKTRASCGASCASCGGVDRGKVGQLDAKEVIHSKMLKNWGKKPREILCLAAEEADPEMFGKLVGSLNRSAPTTYGDAIKSPQWVYKLCEKKVAMHNPCDFRNWVETWGLY